MRVETECSCGAKLQVEWKIEAIRSFDQEAVRAAELLDQFRRDHKTCRISKAAKETKR